MTEITKRNHLSTSQIIILGFSGVILAGSLLLMLPFATTNKEGASFLEALFTSTSAVCVTGLVVQDTATYWTMFGQFIILLLIQVGGMGVVTVAVSISLVSGRKISLMQRSTMQEAISAPKVGGILRLTYFILKISILVEILGAALMAPVFCRDFGLLKGMWYAVFHSVSAFCNAGFDLMGVKTPFSSLTSYTANPLVNGVIMFLIVFGGIGFATWEDIKENRFRMKKYRMQSKIILLTTFVLIIVPFLYYFYFEFSSGVWGNLSLYERLQVSFFQTITPRTAGFNTVDLTRLTESGQTIMIILMLIGGSPGSTAGGMKTTTIFVLFLSAFAVFRRKEDPAYFGRRIDGEVVRTAAAVLLMYVVLVLSGAVLMSCIEDLPILTCLFEAASAIGTVGLTLGITPGLSIFSKLILILLMFFGRVGGLTIIFAAVSGNKQNFARLPLEKVTVG